MLSTCNRTEIYAVVERFHDSYTGLRDALAARAYVSVADLADHVSLSTDEAAARHLFDVAAGLDSAVVGETEILGQIKTAWETARVSVSRRNLRQSGQRTQTGRSRSSKVACDGPRSRCACRATSSPALITRRTFPPVRARNSPSDHPRSASVASSAG